MQYFKLSPHSWLVKIIRDLIDPFKISLADACLNNTGKS